MRSMRRILLSLVLLIGIMPANASAQQSFIVDLAVDSNDPPESCPGYSQVTSHDVEFHLLGCVTDGNGVPIDTSQSDELSIEWRSFQTVELEARPSETGPDGTVATTATVSRDGRHEIEMVLCSGDPCAEVASAVIAIDRWDSDPRCLYNGTNCDGAVLSRFESRRLFMAVGAQVAGCMEGRPVLLKREKDGRDEIVVMEQTRSEGEGSIPIRKTWDGRFYIVAPPWRVTTPDGPVTCNRERSRPLRIRPGFH